MNRKFIISQSNGARFSRKLLFSACLILISYLYSFAVEPVASATGVSDSGPESVQDRHKAAADSVTDEDYTELEDFVIVQRKKLVQSDGAKLTYNVTEDPEAASSNILDVLRKVPGVSVDAEDNVRVNGQTSFKILMNGHEDPMLKGDIKTVLKSLPAASIKKIEVISEPGAKYEAEGIGGILNIVTDKSQDLSGFLTQLSGWVNAYQAGGYLNGRTKIDKVMLDATISYNNGKVWPRTNKSYRETEDLTGGPNHLLTADKRSKNGWDYTGVNLNMSWEPDTLNLFTLSGSFGHNTWFTGGTESRSMFRPDMSTMWSLQRFFRSDGQWNGVGVSASYQHTFGREGHNLVLSYEYDYGHQRDIEDCNIEPLTGNSGETPYTGSRDGGNGNSHIVQIDYANQFNSKHLLELGAKANLNDDSQNNNPYFGQSKENAVLTESMMMNMNQFKDIYAVYGSYTGTFASWNVKAGLRYEHTRMGLKYHVGDYTDFTTRLNDIVPNAAVSYNLSPSSSLRAAYQMRISRPNIYYLNPYVDVLTPGQIQYGNPDLKSEKGHEVSLTYSNYEGAFSGSAKISYRYAANSINDILFMKDDVINSTYANVGTGKSAFLELNGDWSITNDLRWSLYGWVKYTQLKADSELMRAENHGWQCYAYTNVSYTTPGNVCLNAYGGFGTPWIDLQSRGSQNTYYYGLGASRSFLKDDALTLQLSLGNLFPTRRTSGYEQGDDTVRLRLNSSYSQWNVGLSVTFEFGGLKASVKKTDANIEKESSGNNGGQGGK